MFRPGAWVVGACVIMVEVVGASAAVDEFVNVSLVAVLSGIGFVVAVGDCVVGIDISFAVAFAVVISANVLPK